jgi:putative ABC transport system permease protein
MSTSFDYQGSRRTVYRFFVDQEYLRTLGLSLLAGRDPTGGSDGTAVLVNEALVRQFHLGTAIDSAFTFATHRSPENVVAGVVADYHFRPLRWEIEPLILHPLTSDDDMANYVLVRLAPGEIPTAVSLLRQEWERLEPDYPFEYSFLDQDLDRQYATEQRWLRTVQAAAAMAVILACLGLVGLTALAVVQRTREIGIRRVLGASSVGVVSLLVADAVRLVVVAGVLAAPAAYLLLRRWLEGFAFRVDLGPAVFALAATAVLALATLAAAGQAFRAALANPVDALRQE